MQPHPPRLALVALALLAGCSMPEPWRQIESKYVQARIVEINRPKHFRVTIDADGWRYPNVGRSKHCNNWRRNKVGDAFITLRVTYARPNGERKTEFPQLNDQLCR